MGVVLRRRLEDLDVRARDLTAAVASTRQRIAYGHEVLAQLVQARIYKRDKDGKFGTGGGSPEQLHDDEQTIRDTFGYNDEATGMRAEVTAIRSTGPQSKTYVDVKITDRDGNHVGDAVRSIMPADQKTVRHDGMALVADKQGQGFAARFNAHAEESYRANGIERVTTNANIDVGGYSHARAGYDFADPGSRAEAMVHVAKQADNYSQAVRDEVNRHIRNAEHVTPIELAMIGHTPGAKTWPGKEMMLGSNWEGVKEL